LFEERKWLEVEGEVSESRRNRGPLIVGGLVRLRKLFLGRGANHEFGIFTKSKFFEK
jgi:hypothetical protein